MKVISINSLARFHIRLNDSRQLIMPSVIENRADVYRSRVEIEYSGDWQNFLAAGNDTEVAILNTRNHTFDQLIDFEHTALCEKIEYLYIYGAIGDLSDQIQRLPNLKYLEVHDVCTISPRISLLGRLEELVLAHCYRLELIPFELYELTGLKKLTINSLGYYENISLKINRLANLEYLALRDHFPFIDEAFNGLAHLKTLDIEQPNEHVYRIPNLEALHARVLEAGWLKGISAMRNIEELCLDIREFDDELNELASLKYLVILNYSNETMPDLGMLHNLELLVFHCCELAAIPRFVFNLPKLKYLGLRGMNKLRSIPAEINGIPRLKYLDITTDEEYAYELPVFREGLLVYRQDFLGSFERVN